MKPLRLALLALAGSLALMAQGSPRLKAEIPFAFEMSNVTLPAGNYAVTRLSDEKAILITSFEWKKAAIVLGYRVNDGSKDHETAEIVFNRYGDRYFLASIVSPYATHDIPKSKSERELVTSTLIASRKPERISIIASRF